MSFVQQKLFPDLKITGNIEIFGINDEIPVQVPTSVIHITSSSFGTSKEIVLEVGILPHMKWEVLIGNYLFDSSDNLYLLALRVTHDKCDSFADFTPRRMKMIKLFAHQPLADDW